jgi:hypothetical protein
MKILVAVITSLCSLSVLSASATTPDSDSADPLFRDDATLDVTITAPFKTLVQERSTEDYLPGVFHFTGADGTSLEFDVEIRARGHFRHQTRIDSRIDWTERIWISSVPASLLSSQTS